MKRAGLVALAAGLAALAAGLAWTAGGAAGALGRVAQISSGLAVIFTGMIGFQAFRGRELPSLWTVSKILLFAVVLALVCQLFQSYRRPVALSWIAVAASAAVLLLLVRRAPQRGRVDVVLVNACLILVGGELALRLVAAVRPSPLLARPSMEAAQFVDSRRGTPGAAHGGMTFNSLGEYDDEPHPKRPGECLVVVIGDSFSVGIVAHRFHFTTVAERALPGCSFYNMGVVEIGPPEYLYLLQKEALDLKPDLIIVDLFVGNDLGAGPPEESPGARRLRAWLDRDNFLLFTVPRRLWRWGRARGAGTRPIGAPPIAEPDARWAMNPAREQPSFPRETFLDIEEERAEQACTDQPGMYAALFAELGRIRRAAGGVPLAFMLIPDELQVEDDLWAEVQTRRPKLRLERDHAQRVLGAWFAQHKVPYLDLLPVLRAAPSWDDGKKHYYHLNDTHFNARGNQVAGGALAGFAQTLLKR